MRCICLAKNLSTRQVACYGNKILLSGQLRPCTISEIGCPSCRSRLNLHLSFGAPSFAPPQPETKEFAVQAGKKKGYVDFSRLACEFALESHKFQQHSHTQGGTMLFTWPFPALGGPTTSRQAIGVLMLHEGWRVSPVRLTSWFAFLVLTMLSSRTSTFHTANCMQHGARGRFKLFLSSITKECSLLKVIVSQEMHICAGS